MAFLLLHRDDRRREAVQRRPVGLIDAEDNQVNRTTRYAADQNGGHRLLSTL